jgi:hypothetical protein
MKERSMAYRDDLQAAHERIRFLEGELARSRVVPKEKPAPKPPTPIGAFVRLLVRRFWTFTWMVLIGVGVPSAFLAFAVWIGFFAVSIKGSCLEPDMFCYGVLSLPTWVRWSVLLAPVVLALCWFVRSTWNDAKAAAK